MTLSLDPLTTDAWGQIIDVLKSKIENPNLSFVKYLNSIGMPLRKVYTQKEPDGSGNGWDPNLSRCPAVTLLASAFPFADDHGAGDERWYFSVTVMFKMQVRRGDASEAFQASHELLRTIWAGWRPGNEDPFSAIRGIHSYRVEGNVTPHIADDSAGREAARVAFDVRFRLAETILG